MFAHEILQPTHQASRRSSVRKTHRTVRRKNMPSWPHSRDPTDSTCHFGIFFRSTTWHTFNSTHANHTQHQAHAMIPLHCTKFLIHLRHGVAATENLGIHCISWRECLLHQGDTLESCELFKVVCQCGLARRCFLGFIGIGSLFVSLFLIERIMQQPIPMPLHFRA